MDLKGCLKYISLFILISLTNCGNSEKETQEARTREQQRQEQIRKKHKKEKREQFLASQRQIEIEKNRKEEEKREIEERKREEQNSSYNSYNSTSNSAERSIYSTDEGRTAYLEVLQLQKEVKSFINQSFQYRKIMSSEPYMSVRWQMANINNKDLLEAAINKQEKAISIARSKLHDDELLRELKGQLEVLKQYY